MSGSHHLRRTKIVATLGPAWEQREQIERLLEAGVDVVRINASHGTAELRLTWIERVREAIEARASRASAAVLVDLQGPRIRVGTLEAPRELASGRRVTFAPEGFAGPDEIPTTYAGLARDCTPGARILLDDGLLEVLVDAVEGDRVIGTVRHGGLLRSSKGMNLPGIEMSVPALSDRDREEAARAVKAGADYLAISFVRRPEDVEALRALVPADVRVIAKIEKDTALERLPAILAVSDAIMVARGDLGVELPFEEVPLVQKRLIRLAGLASRPVITATQMLESMVQHPRPTRAEASDVANAILDGTDAVMLSAETAVGKYAAEAVEAMVRIIREVERSQTAVRTGEEGRVRRTGIGRFRAPIVEGDGQQESTADAIAVAVSAAAASIAAPVIVCFTSSGFTARAVAAHRPPVPIVAFTPEPRTHRQLALVWGVLPVLCPHVPTYEQLLPIAMAELTRRGLAASGERIVVTAGVPFDVAGTTNLMRVETV